MCPTAMVLSLDTSQVPGASFTAVNHEYVMLMSTDGASATGRVQCTWSYGEGTPIVHAYETRLQGQPVTAFRHAIFCRVYLSKRRTLPHGDIAMTEGTLRWHE